MEKRFLDAMESDIMKADIFDAERNKLLKNSLHLNLTVFFLFDRLKRFD